MLMDTDERRNLSGHRTRPCTRTLPYFCLACVRWPSALAAETGRRGKNCPTASRVCDRNEPRDPPKRWISGFFAIGGPALRPVRSRGARLLIPIETGCLPWPTTSGSGSSTRRCATASSRPARSMNLAEKIEVARHSRALGVDIIEAGFPIASPATSRPCGRSPPRSPARPSAAWPAASTGTSSARGRPSARAEAAHPRLPGHLGDPPRVQAAKEHGEIVKQAVAGVKRAEGVLRRTSSSAPRTPRAPSRTSCARSSRRSSTPARRRSTSPTPSATPCRPSSAS